MQRALADAEGALKAAREIGHAATLRYALSYIPTSLVLRGDHTNGRSMPNSLRGEFLTVVCRFHFTSALKSLGDLSTRL
jgi:hypothetical protein